MNDHVEEKISKISVKRMWIGLAGVSILIVSLYFVPYILERVLQKQLQSIGYQAIELSHIGWSYFGRGFQFQHLKASGEGLPVIFMGKTNMWLEPTKLWNATLELHLDSIMFDGNMTVLLSNHLWRGHSEAKATLVNFSIAKLVAAIPSVNNYFPMQTLENPIDGQLGLEMTGFWSDKLQAIPTVNADIFVKNLQLPASANQPAIAAETLEIKQLKYHPSGKTFGRIQVGDITINTIKTLNLDTQTGAHALPLSIAELHISQLKMIDGNTLSIGGLDVLNAQTGIDSKPLAVVENLKLQEIQWQVDKGLSLASLDLNKGKVSAEIDALGQFSSWKIWFAGLPVMAKEKKEKLEGDKERGEIKTMPVVIQKVVIQAFKVDFSDKSKTPVVRLPLMIQNLTAENMLLIKNAKPIVWQASGVLGGQGQWDANGVLHPFAMDQAGSGELHIQGLELSLLSGYFAQSYGKGIRSGNLDMNLLISIKQGFLKSAGDLFARKVSFSDIKGGEAVSKMMMPLGSALDVLKDGDDNITLQFSSEGKLDDPSFKLSGVWDKVLSKAASRSVIFLVGQALQPYALVLTAGEYLYDQSKHISLKPIVFTQGHATGKDAHPDMKAYAEKMADLLSKKTSLLLEICPQYTLGESDYGEKLSLERSKLLSNHLMELGVARNRVTNCLPELDEGTEAKPRLELSLI